MDFSIGQSFCDLCGLRLLDLILHAETPAFNYHGFRMVHETVRHGAGLGAVVVEGAMFPIFGVLMGF